MDRNKYKNMGSKRLIPNKRGLYSKVAKYADEAISTLVNLMQNSKNDTVRVSAAKSLLDKCLPNVKDNYQNEIENEKLQGYKDLVKNELRDYSD